MGDVMGIILPIVIILGLGYYCRRQGILTAQGVEGIKTVSIKFLWPMVLFYAFFTANYGRETILYAALNFFTNLIAFLIGLLIRKSGPSHAFSYPYLLSGFETGMIGYAMYTLLFGADKISYLALLDVGHALFIFPIFLTYLNMEQDQGDLKSSLKDMMKSAIMIALIVGMVSGITGFGRLVMGSWAGAVIDKLYSLVSSANVVMILIVMGYGISFSLSQLKESARVILIRMAIMLGCTLGSLWILRSFAQLNVYLACAVILTYIMPPVYMLAVYVKDPEENEFMSTTSSVYTLLSIAAFLIMCLAVG